MQPRTILAIETSCDETALALVRATGARIRVLATIVSSQAALHAAWGGVVPNLAKREHQKNLVPLLLQALNESTKKDTRFKIYDLRKKTDDKYLTSNILHLTSILEREPELLSQFKKDILPLKKPNIDTIAVTQGPGLEPALWVGVNFARALSYVWGMPLVGINHMEGHVASALLKKTASHYSLKPVRYPALALLVSGGHTELVLIKKPLSYEIIGETRDDAAGEAFDKVARILGLGYPGGPFISIEAGKFKDFGDPISEIHLPRPMMNSKDFDFSFSGLKTAVLYLVRDLEKQGANIKKLRPVICNEFQNAVVEVLVAKTIRAAKQYKVKTILLGGGVAANKELQKRLAAESKSELPSIHLHIPDANVTGDNALMIAAAAALTSARASKTAWKTMRPDAIMRL